MTEATYTVPRHSVAATVLILVIGATIGAVWGLILAFISGTAMVTAGGPLALLIAGPLLFAVFGLSTTWVVIGTPLWALIGGGIFATQASGDMGSAARILGVTFFTDEHPITQATQWMAKQLGLPPVRFVGWYDADEINAFAMGTSQDYALIAVSKGAIDNLSKEQLDAVLAHELGHVASNDMARMTYARGVREALTFFLLFQGLKKFARWVFTPFSELELLRFSRQREFTADEISAHLTSPDAMISVLESLKASAVKTPTDDWTMIKMAALGGDSWLSTHPPLDARIQALKALASASPSKLPPVAPVTATNAVPG